MKLEEAKAALDDLFFDFPFPTAADETNLYAAIITKICRRSYAKAPLMMIDKPKSGTGATLLSELVSLLTTGRLPMRATYSPGEMLEFEKRVASTCRDANGIVLLDNLAGTIVSSMLADLLTAEDKFPARDLGFSRNFILNPRNYVLMATANNVSMAAELVNRTLHIRLDAGVERPDHRNGFRRPNVTDYPAGQPAPPAQRRAVAGAPLAGGRASRGLRASQGAPSLPCLAATDGRGPGGHRIRRLHRQRRGVRGTGHHGSRGVAAPFHPVVVGNPPGQSRWRKGAGPHGPGQRRG